MLIEINVYLEKRTNMVDALILLVVGGKMRIFPYLPSKNKAPASVVLIELDFILRKASRG